jgi:aerobic carbon-monoxide dehydrogenase medium subunit
MKPAPFAYHAPDTLQDAIGLLSSCENAKILAGGQSLVPMLNMRFAVPDHLIDLNRIQALSGISVSDGVIEIGAMTRQSTLEASKEIAASLPVMAEALPHVGHFQTRSRGTIGGSLCHLDPSGELPAICLLTDATLVISGPRGNRTISVLDWFQGFMQPALEPDEVLTSLQIKRWPAAHGFGFSEFSRRHGDFAIAGAAALITLNRQDVIDRCAIVAFGVEVTPRRLTEAERMLAGIAPAQDAFREAAAQAEALDAMGDATASASYRKKVGAAMVHRALIAAYESAQRHSQ